MEFHCALGTSRSATREAFKESTLEELHEIPVKELYEAPLNGTWKCSLVHLKAHLKEPPE